MLDKQLNDIFKAERRRITENLELKAQLRETTKAMNAIHIAFWLMVVVIVLLIYLHFETDKYEPELLSETPPNITIDYSGLELEEKIIAKSLIGEMKLIYLRPIKSLKFTKNLSQYYNGTADLNRLRGFYRRGHVFIKWTGDTKQMAKTVCHEALHGVIRRGDVPHDIVYDLAEYYPCFEEK